VSNRQFCFFDHEALIQIAGRTLMEVCTVAKQDRVVMSNAIQCPPQYGAHKKTFLTLASSVRRRLHKFANKGLRGVVTCSGYSALFSLLLLQR